MFWSKLKYLFSQIWLSYVILAGAAIIITYSLKQSEKNPIYAFGGLILFVVALFILSLFSALKLKRKINVIRKEEGKESIGVMDVELSSSIPILDISFLMFASWKIGEAAMKLLESISLVDHKAIPYLFSIIALTLISLIYSFIKVFDRIKEHQGIAFNNANKDQNTRDEGSLYRVRNSAVEMLTSLLLLVVIPAVTGIISYFIFLRSS